MKDNVVINENQSWTTNYKKDLEKKASELQQLMEERVKVEKQLDTIRESLRGMLATFLSFICSIQGKLMGSRKNLTKRRLK